MSSDSLQYAVELIMKKYDLEKKGELDSDSIYLLIKDSREFLGSKKKITSDEVSSFLSRAKASKNGRLTS